MNECSIVRDLIPLYIEKECSEDTKEYIEKHLKECTECSAVYERMSCSIMNQNLDIDSISIEPLKKIKKKNEKVKNAFYLLQGLVLIMLMIGINIIKSNNLGLSFKPEIISKNLTEKLITEGINSYTEKLVPQREYRSLLNVIEYGFKSYELKNQSNEHDTERLDIGDVEYICSKDYIDNNLRYMYAADWTKQYLYGNMKAYVNGALKYLNNIILDEKTYEAFAEKDIYVQKFELGGKSYYTNYKGVIGLYKYERSYHFPDGRDEKYQAEVNILDFINTVYFVPEELYEYFEKENAVIEEIKDDYIKAYEEYSFNDFKRDYQNGIRILLENTAEYNGTITGYSFKYPAMKVSGEYIVTGSLTFESGYEQRIYYYVSGDMKTVSLYIPN